MVTPTGSSSASIGPDPRIALRADAALSVADRAEISARLARLDRASSHGPWTAVTLRAIESAPGTRAADLAAGLGREQLPFKADVRKLKALGLTESLEVGYRLSPRGRAYLGRSARSRPQADTIAQTASSSTKPHSCRAARRGRAPPSPRG